MARVVNPELYQDELLRIVEDRRDHERFDLRLIRRGSRGRGVAVIIRPARWKLPGTSPVDELVIPGKATLRALADAIDEAVGVGLPMEYKDLIRICGKVLPFIPEERRREFETAVVRVQRLEAPARGRR